MNKFHKEPYIQFHIYAQYFHPETLLERVRDVNFYRRPRTLFKGFRVPDWATAEKRHGWELDAYSRQAWENAMHDLNSEWTPTQFTGERQEPNVIEWFRLEQWGKGNSSRLFYNEVPKPTWFRYGGHLDNVEKDVYSFTHADQEHKFVFGVDTTTPEGREEFKKEWENLCQIAPELLSKEDMVYPHEAPAQIPNEPHFMRIWQHYREHMFKVRLAYLVQQGQVSQEDADAFRRFTSLSSQPTFSLYIYGRLGQLPHLENDAGYQATCRIMEKLGLDQIKIDRKSAQPYEQQFWDQYDVVQELNEEEMRKELPAFVTDPANKAKVEAIISGRRQAALGHDQTHRLEASA